MPPRAAAPWSPDSWKSRPAAHQAAYEDSAALDAAVRELGALPPLVTSGEIERLRRDIAQAQEGKRFLLQGGDCAETIADCRDSIITGKLKILLQMSLVLVHGLRKPVIRVGRIAGQYAKPRSSPTESRNGVALPSYFGDLVNRADFSAEARKPDPRLLVRGYQHAAMTLNFIRSLIDGGFADLHHPEYWDLRFLHHASLPQSLREDYQRMTRQLAEALRFMETLGETSIDELTSVEFFTSHEGLNLHYESAQTRQVPRRQGYYDLTTHLPWIGDRTRDVSGAHVEYFRGVRNPLGVKLGAGAKPDEALALAETLNSENEPGRLLFIHRMGAAAIERALPPILEAIKGAGRRVLWVCDPMHGNGVVTKGGHKTRNFDDVLRELELAAKLHHESGTILGGVHIELTAEDVTECIGGAAGVSESDLSTNYATACDPRLNYQQAMELAFVLAKRLAPASA